MIDQDLSNYEVIGFRKPSRGELYFYRTGVQLAGSPSESYPRPQYIVRKRRQLSTPVVNLTTSIVESPLPESAATAKAKLPVLVAEFFDADGNSSTNTFYDAELAARFYGR